MSRARIFALCAFLWGTVAGVFLAIVAAGSAQTTNPNGIGTLYLDGVPVATYQGAEYYPADGELRVVTYEIVLDCLTDRVFDDRFEADGGAP